jgi:hypothetical protein
VSRPTQLCSTSHTLDMEQHEVNACVKFLLYCVHGGYMWLDRPISIDTDLIARITGLPTQGEDPTLLFADKKKTGLCQRP